MSLVNRIAAQAYRTFSRGSGEAEQLFQQNLSQLRDLMGRLTGQDVNFDGGLVSDSTPFNRNSGLAPVTFIDIWNDEHFSMSIFVLKPGTRLPMHDHPGMHGLIRVIHGRMNVFSYSLRERKSGDGFEFLHGSESGKDYFVKKGCVFTAERMCSASGDVVDVNSEAVVLTPVDGNLHEIRTMDSAAAFFDVLAPPYSEDRHGPHQCHYFKELSLASKSSTKLTTSAQPDTRLCSLICIPPPMDYWTDYAPYDGPIINPYDSSVTA